MLKKLIVIMAVLALVAGTAFAQPSMGGQLMIGANLLEGNNAEDSDITMGGIGFHEAKLNAVFGDSKGGGKFVMVTSNPNGTAYNHGIGSQVDGKAINLQTWGFLYWRPVAQFRMQIGVNADGDFGAAQISGWGFTGEAKNSVAAMNEYEEWEKVWWPLWVWQSGGRQGNAFYPGTGDLANVNFQFFPVDGLIATLVIPINGGQELDLQTQISDFQFNARYTIEEAGILNVSFIGRGGLGKDMDKAASAGDIYASFFLNAIQGMGAELGLTYNIPYKDASDVEHGGYMGVGAGFRLDNGGPFTFKLRANATLGGKVADKDRTTLIYANILPCYKINNNVWAFFYAGVGVETAWADYDGSRIGWFVNPYIWVRAAEGLRFWTGLQVYQDGRRDGQFGESADSPLSWRVPFGFNFYF